MTPNFTKAILVSLQVLLCTGLLAQPTEEQFVKNLLRKNAGLLLFTESDIAEADITKTYTDASGIRFVYCQQSYQKIEVQNAILSLAFRDDTLVSATGHFVPQPEGKARGMTPQLSASEALQKAVRQLELNKSSNLVAVQEISHTGNKYAFAPGNMARRNIEVKLLWLPTDDLQILRLSWNVSIEVKGQADWWEVQVDAYTGDILSKYNRIVNEIRLWHADAGAAYSAVSVNTSTTPYKPVFTKQQVKNTVITTTPLPSIFNAAPIQGPASNYRVIPFPKEKPDSAISGNGFAIVIDPWRAATVFDTGAAVTLRWHSDNVTNYQITRGNNSFAYLGTNPDSPANLQSNWPDTMLPSPNAPLTFSHTWNNTVQPDSSKENKKVVLDNLFYWTNLLHDIFYQYGFEETAGNFQKNNLGRGGAANDWMNVLTQDASEYNNAGYIPTEDGVPGTLRMQLWQTTPSFKIDEPPSISSFYPAKESALSNINKLKQRPQGTLSGQIFLYNDIVTGWLNVGCAPATNALQLNGKIALIYSPIPNDSCSFQRKAMNAQNAGCIGIVMYGNDTASFAIQGGPFNNFTIPIVSVGKATADAIIYNLEQGIVVKVTVKTGIYRDAGLDNGIVCHEYGHGVTHRLTGGNPNCLTNAETPDEGWSDYFALMLTTNWRNTQLTDSTKPRTIGSYASEGIGIRRKPYCTNMTVNPYTYADLATDPEKHAIGEVWCAALWDMTWQIIAQQQYIDTSIYAANSSTGGNTIALKLVMKGLQMQPCQPGFLRARDAILKADTLYFNKAYSCAIWKAFARRGMGVTALQGASGNDGANSATDQFANFDVPTTCKSLPVMFTTIKAFEKNTGIQVNWENSTEYDMRHYEVQKSANGQDFSRIAVINARYNHNTTARYDCFDANPYNGNNFYRIKAIELGGNSFYSSIVNVRTGNTIATIVLYPNPVKSKELFIQLSNQPAGKYNLQLLNNLGQVLQQNELEHLGGSATQTFRLPQSLPKGVYQVLISSGQNKVIRKIICE